jgi:hypothetical protein
MVAGVDATGPSVFWVDQEGTRQKMPRVCSIGSGSLSAFGFLLILKQYSISIKKKSYFLTRKIILIMLNIRHPGHLLQAGDDGRRSNRAWQACNHARQLPGHWLGRLLHWFYFFC